MSTTDNVEIYTLDKYLKLKEQGFEFEGESYLFWEYMRILTDIRKYNPDVLFLLENVEMGKKWERVLSEAIGVYGVHINSALVSAQNRKRIYWTNIRTRPEGFFGDLHSDIPQPADRGILLKDILESEVDEKYYLSEKMLDYLNRNSELQKENGNGFKFQPFTDFEIKSKTVTNKEGNRMDDNFIVAMRGREACLTPKRTEYGKQIRKDYEAGRIAEQRKNIQQLEPRQDGKTNTLTSVQKDNLVMQLNPSKESGGKQPYQQNRIYDTEGIAPALCANKADLIIKEAVGCDYRSDEGVRYRPNGKSGTLAARARNDESCGQLVSVTENYIQWDGTGFDQDNRAYYEDGKSGTLDVKAGRQKVLQNQISKLTNRIRRLTPTECARLQTIPNWYKWEVSDTQQYKLLGNGWTVEVIKHILNHI
jgi:site-specific DNA-cytosine methylase